MCVCVCVCVCALARILCVCERECVCVCVCMRVCNCFYFAFVYLFCLFAVVKYQESHFMNLCCHVCSFNRSVMADIHKSSRSDDSLWGKLFEAFGGRSELITEKLKEGVQTDLLDHRRIRTPPNLGELLHRGVPCTCRLRPQDMPRGPSWTLVSLY